MNAVIADNVAAFDRVASAAPALRTQRLALLGTGTVGRAFVGRYERLVQQEFELPRFEWLANSRGLRECADAPDAALRIADALPRHHVAATTDIALADLRRGDIVVDASASEEVASQHAVWLARGLHVITANKLGNGASLRRAQEISEACDESGAFYGDSATVGAGLPLLRSLRALAAGGDRIHSIRGVLSGSLAWLFHHYDGVRAFSGLVRAARDAGYTEPDPRSDLSGEDVRRKLLILARTAGVPLEADAVEVESLVPTELASAANDDLDAALPLLDAPLKQRFQLAYRKAAKLRFVGRIEISADNECHASVGLQVLPFDHPLCGGSGTDNRVAIWSDRYREQPLLIQGPGAGAEVTAAALLDDVLRIANA